MSRERRSGDTARESLSRSEQWSTETPKVLRTTCNVAKIDASSQRMMLLPMTEEQGHAWRSLALGSSVPHTFPAGRFEFLLGEEDALGRYQMCSLFSPMFDFADAEAAMATAEAVMAALFEAGETLAPTDEERELEAVLTGKPLAAGTPDEPEKPAPPKPMSRRALITGFRSGGGRDAG